MKSDKVECLSKLLTIKQFCEINNITESTFQRIMREGNGPKVMKLKRKRF